MTPTGWAAAAAHPFFIVEPGRKLLTYLEGTAEPQERLSRREPGPDVKQHRRSASRSANKSSRTTLKIKREHSLGVEEARRRVDQVADELGGKLGLTSQWEGDHLRVRGKGVSGKILVSEDSVEVHVHVGLAMMMLREPIRSAIESSIDEYIA